MNRAEKRRQHKLAKKAVKSKKYTPSPNSTFTQQDQNLTNLLNLGIKKHNLGELSKAESLYNKVLLVDPVQPVALHLLGVIKQQLGYNAAAEDLISKALTIRPDYFEAHNSLGLVLIGLNKLEEAVTSYQRALTINFEFAEAHNNLGLAFQKQRNFIDALACYRKAVAINPGYSKAYYNLGNTLWEQGAENFEETIVNYKKALSINHDFFEAHGNLGMVLRDQGKLDEAAASFRKALNINPDYAEAHSNLGSVLKELGQLDEASASHRKALAIKPNFAEAYYNLHALLLDPNDMAPSINCLQSAVDIDPKNVNYRFILGMLLDYSGKHREAERHFVLVEGGDKKDRAKLDAWRYIKTANKTLPPIFGSSIQAFRLGIDAAQIDGLVLEFGVRFGTSIHLIADLVTQEVHGFDSFEGLPEAWHSEPKGSYSTKGAIPVVQENVVLHTGWFEETLPGFIEKFPSPIRFMNIDCDLYSSTKTVLEVLSHQIVPGTVIAFDEYIGNESWREDEFRAFQEAAKVYDWNFDYLCFSFMTKQVVVQIN